jgi:rubrerythrin
MTKIHQEGLEETYAKLKSKKTLDEILEVVISFEKVAHDFYSSLIPKVSKDIRYLVEELAEEEQQHYELFNGLKDDPYVLAQLQEKIIIPAENNKFADYINLPDLGKNMNDKSILEYALAREDAAMKQYHDLAKTTPDGALKSVFQFLAYEETQHKLELEKKYDDIIHSGGSGKK